MVPAYGKPPFIFGSGRYDARGADSAYYRASCRRLRSPGNRRKGEIKVPDGEKWGLTSPGKEGKGLSLWQA